MDYYKKRTSKNIWQAGNGLHSPFFVSNVQKKKRGSKIKMGLNVLEIFNKPFPRNVILKGLLEWLDYISGQNCQNLPKFAKIEHYSGTLFFVVIVI